DLIGKSTKKLDLTLGELLDATRINDANFKPEAVNLKQLVDETFESLKGVYDPDSIQLKSQIGHKSLINTDPHLLKSILQNLISNGINFANHEVEEPFVQVSTRTTPDKLYIEIQDNGVGIPDRVQPKVFEMFYRGHNQSEGSGLGLYVVKNAAKKIGAEIDFESSEGKGSTFTLTLPLKVQAPISQLQN
ncbi:MAG: HAMP domain-containing sensor histidine kinase, partial [Bacteroidota bacterium]